MTRGQACERLGRCCLRLFPQAMSQVAACRHLATAARVKDPAALQRCKFDTPLLAARSLICVLSLAFPLCQVRA